MGDHTAESLRARLEHWERHIGVPVGFAALLDEAIAALEAAERERDEARKLAESRRWRAEEAADLHALDILRAAVEGMARPVTPGPWRVVGDSARGGLGIEQDDDGPLASAIIYAHGSFMPPLTQDARAIATLPDLWAAVDALLADAWMTEVDRPMVKRADQRNRAEKAERERDEARAEVERLRGEVEIWRESARIAAGEEYLNERHCTCVPVLRVEVERLRAALVKIADREARLDAGEIVGRPADIARRALDGEA